MPTPDEELDALLGSNAPAGKTKSPDEELDALLAGDAAPASKSHVIEMPTQTIEYDPSVVGKPGVPPPAPSAQAEPWYRRLANKLKPDAGTAEAVLRGAGSGATLNFGEEGAAGLASLLPKPKDPEGFDREYKAGSRYADMRNTLEGDNARARQEHPAAYMAGELAGSAPLAIATGAGAAEATTPLLRGGLGLSKPVAGVLESGALGGALGGVSGAGADVENRARGALRGAAAGAVTGAALHGAAEGASATADNALNASNKLIVQTFMTPAQRAAYTRAHGPDSLRELGQATREAGLYKGLRPTTAAKVADNANRVMTESGNDIHGFEDDLASRGVNPDVDIQPIVDSLHNEANAHNGLSVAGADKVGRAFQEQADLLGKPQDASVAGKIEKPPALPEWALASSNKPKAGAAVEPVQEPLPGTELPPIAADRPQPLPPEPEQLSLPMPTPRTMPNKQLGLGLEPQQAKLNLPPAEAPKNLRQPMTFDQLPVRLPSGGTAQEPLPGLAQLDPAKPQAPAIEPPQAPAPTQLGLNLPARQTSLPLDQPAPSSSPSPAPAPVDSDPLAGQQTALDPQYIDVARGPQPEQSTSLPPAPAQISRDTMPFSEAMQNKRFLGKQIDWQNNPRAQQSATDLGPNEVRKMTWKGIAQQIDKALKGDPRVDQNALDKYNKAKANFSAAATAFDPAVKMMERQQEVGLGARDLMTGTLLGAGNPVTGGLSAMASKTGAGMTPGIGSAALRGYAHGANALAPLLRAGAKVAPIVEARRQNPGASQAQVRQQANEQTKRDLSVLLQQKRDK